MADSHRDAEFARELFGNEPARAGRIYRWQVGWRDSGETFASHSGSTEVSMGAARFAAEVTVQALATDPVPAENLVCAGQAACSYSWRMPPRRSRLRMLRRAILAGSAIVVGNGCSGLAFAMPWCGRCAL
jgi:hypothetical protein